jgi:hypothetical protein
VNERTLRPSRLAAAAALIGGILLIALPQHAMSIVRLVIVTIAVGSALYVLAVHVPTTGWISPFKWMSPFSRGSVRVRRRRRVGELDVLRSSLGGRRQPVEGGPALPPAIVRTLQPMITLALDLDARLLRRAALDGHDAGPDAAAGHGPPADSEEGPPPARRPLGPRDRSMLAAARERISPSTWAVLTAEPLHRPGWLRTLRPDALAVAGAVQRILDELDPLMGGAPPRSGSPDSTHMSHTRATP